MVAMELEFPHFFFTFLRKIKADDTPERNGGIHFQGLYNFLVANFIYLFPMLSPFLQSIVSFSHYIGIVSHVCFICWCFCVVFSRYCVCICKKLKRNGTIILLISVGFISWPIRYLNNISKLPPTNCCLHP